MNNYRVFLIFFLILAVNIFPDNQRGPKSRHAAQKFPGIKTISLIFTITRDSAGIPGQKKPGNQAEEFLLYHAVERLFNREYYPYAQIKKAGKTDYTFKVTVSAGNNRSLITTAATSSSLKVSSTLPAVPSSPLVSVIAGDVFFLFAESETFSFLSYSTPPRVSLALNTDKLSRLTGWKQDKLSPLDLAPSSRGVLITLEGGFLTLGNSLEATYNTIVDLFYQKNYSMSLHPLAASSDLLGNTMLLSRNTEYVYFIKADRTKNSAADLKLKEKGSFLYAGLSTGGFAVLDESANSSKTVSFYMPGKSTNKYPLNSAFISAMASDYGGNLWLYDSIEKRIRIISTEGMEIGSLKPIIPSGLLLFPQVLSVYPDGSFILGGSGILVKFDTAGIPIWKLRNYRFKGFRSIPAFYRLACSGQDTSFFILDMQSQRILKFQETPQTENSISFSADSVLYGIKSSSLTPVELAKAKSKKLALLKERAGIYYEKQLDFKEAEEFYRQSLAAFREIRKQDPVDKDAPAEIEKLISARNRVKGKALLKNTVSVSLFTHTFYNSSHTVSLRITNLTESTVNDIVLRINIPGFSLRTTEKRISQLAPYKSRRINLSLALKRNTAGFKQDINARLNTVINFTIRNESGETRLSFPVSFRGRNYIKAHASAVDAFTEFYMPKNRVIAEFASSLTDYFHKYFYLNGRELKGTVIMSVLETILENNVRHHQNITNSDLFYIVEPPLYPVFFLSTGITAGNSAIYGKGESVSTIMFIASVSANLGFKPFLLFREGETILLIDTFIPLESLNMSSEYLYELKALAKSLTDEGNGKKQHLIIPVYSTGIEKKEAADKARKPHLCFPSSAGTVAALLEHIHKIGIHSYKQLKLIPNSVPAVYHGINGENYLTIFNFPVLIDGKKGKCRDLSAILSGIAEKR
ncbi:MAG: hypothetical protein J7K04_00820 [Spirochaetales bacterium]|nr:hypothetical protein [Spirochaetales bacterium]